MTPVLPFALCADDYAMTPGVSRGIVEALEARALSATSVMTTSACWPDDAGALAPFVGRADIGLHLNLTLGAPLGPMPDLAPDGVLPRIGALLRRARRADLPLAEIAAEIERQADRFVSVFGRPPDHVDGHQHVQMIAAIRPLLFDELARRGWTPWLRDSADRPSRILGRRRDVPKALAVTAVGRGFRRAAAARGFKTNEGFAGFSAFDGRPYADAFARYVAWPGGRHLVMCHPGYVDDALRAIDPVTESRERELAFLTSPAFAETIARRGAVLARLRDIHRR